MSIENNNENKGTIKWWRYPVSIVAFILAFFIMPALFGVALQLTDLITPSFFKSGGLWMHILASILGVGTAFEIMERIMLKRKYVFQTIWSAIVAAYSFFVAIWNRFYGASTPEQFFGMIAIGIVAIAHVGIYCRNNANT